MNTAKVLLVDIEASNLSASIGYILCIGYKWLHEKKAHILRIDQTKEFKKKKTDDTGLLKTFEKVYQEADCVVHHFGTYYDIPFIQTRRLIKGLLPMPEVATVDTWKICKKKLKFHSNRLEAILSSLKCPIKKTPIMGDVWVDAIAGDKKAINYIVDHCKKDVLVLEWVYNKIKAIWPFHPNLTKKTLRTDERICPICTIETLHLAGTRASTKEVYQRLVCSKCGHWIKGKKVR